LSATRSGGDEEGALPRPPPPERSSIELHEEQLRIGVRRVAAGAARLRKRVLKERQTLEVSALVDAAVVVERRPVARRLGPEPQEGVFVVSILRDEIRLEARPRVYERISATVATERAPQAVETEVRREEVREQREQIGGRDAEKER
jgi:uncharacterized protein (TIGR02271 family)